MTITRTKPTNPLAEEDRYFAVPDGEQYDSGDTIEFDGHLYRIKETWHGGARGTRILTNIEAAAIRKRERVARRRVARGAALLDAAKPGWWRPRNVKIASLDMSLGDRCVVGQNYSFVYTRGVEQLLPTTRSNYEDYDTRAAITHGFEVDRHAEPDYLRGGRNFRRAYELLTQLWVEEIKARRRAAKTVVNV